MAEFRSLFLRRAVAAGTLAALLPSIRLLSGEADVIEVRAHHGGSGTYSFDVTVRHADAGWDHYANRWEVLMPDGKTVLGTRTLLHPHDHEQPFTRSLSGVRIPEGVTEVLVRAHDSVHGYGGAELRVKLER